ncbi:MAG: hypothetical protein KJP06_06305 [Deltaproteobacteria bacterium]|nr:hypothetical protein [Deltaproteobacteria bacterium]
MKIFGIFIMVVFSFICANVWAKEQTFRSPLDNRFSVWGGAEFYNANGEFSSTKEGRPDIDLELDDLDLEDKDVNAIFGAIINFGKRFTTRLDYFGYHNSSKTDAKFDFNFDDIIVPVGARIDSSLDMDFYVVNFAYNFISTRRARIGLGVGVHAVDMDLEIAAKVTAGDKEKFVGEGHASLLAPLPNIYLGGAYAFTEKFLARFGGGWMSLSSGDFDGRLLAADVQLEYWPFKNAGLGAGYRYTTIDVDYDDGAKEEKYNLTIPGPLLYVITGF